MDVRGGAAAWALLILAVAWVGWGGPLPGVQRTASEPLEGPIHLILAPGLSWDDLALMEGTRGWNRVLSEGALGNMNTRTAGRGSRPEAYLTLASGARASFPRDGLGGWMSQEIIPGYGEAGGVYAQMTGRQTVAAVVFPFWPQIQAAQEDLGHRVSPGLLASQLASLDLKTAVLANADLPGQFDRWAALAVIDSKGTVPLGRVDDGLLRPEAAFPGGAQLSWQVIMREIENLPPSCGLVAVEISDLVRLHAWRERMDPVHWGDLRRQVLVEAGQFLDWLLAREPGAVLVVSTWPDQERAGSGGLAPVILWGRGNGLLTSPSTRSSGVVANADLAATIPALLTGQEYRLGYGRAMTTTSVSASAAEMARNAQALHLNDQRRAPLIQVYAGLSLMAVVSGGAFWFLGAPSRAWVKLLSLAALSLPLALVLLGFWPALTPWISVLLALALAGLAVVLLYPSPHPVLYLSLAAWTLILGEVWTGGLLAAGSPLGYSQVAGARYYGLGNEMGGLVAGGGLLLAGMGGGRAASLILPVSAMTLAGPALGANFGLALALGIGWATAALSRRGALAVVAGAALVVVLVGGSLLVLDGMRGLEVRSHVGFLLSGDQPLREILETARRKMELNLRLLGWTVWTRVFLGTGALFAWLLWTRPGPLQAVLNRRPGLEASLLGALVGSLAALILNDSGVVAAATWLIFPAFGLLIIVVEEGANSDGDTGGRERIGSRTRG